MPVEERRVYIAELLHLVNRRASFDELLLGSGNFLGRNAREVLDEIFPYRLQRLACRKALQETLEHSRASRSLSVRHACRSSRMGAAAAAFAVHMGMRLVRTARAARVRRSSFILLDREAARLQFAHDIFQLHSFDRHTLGHGHDAAHDVQDHRIRDLLEADLRHCLLKLRKLLDKFRHRFIEVQFLFHIDLSCSKSECVSHCSHYSRYGLRLSSYLLRVLEQHWLSLILTMPMMHDILSRRIVMKK